MLGWGLGLVVDHGRWRWELEVGAELGVVPESPGLLLFGVGLCPLGPESIALRVGASSLSCPVHCLDPLGEGVGNLGVPAALHFLGSCCSGWVRLSVLGNGGGPASEVPGLVSGVFHLLFGGMTDCCAGESDLLLVGVCGFFCPLTAPSSDEFCEVLGSGGGFCGGG